MKSPNLFIVAAVAFLFLASAPLCVADNETQEQEITGDKVVDYLSSDIGLILTGLVTILGLIAALIRSPYAALAGLILAVIDVLLFLWYDLGWSI
jgi:hypothetical protein